MRSTAVFPPNRNPNSTLTLIVTYPVSQCVAFNPGSAMPLFRIPYSKNTCGPFLPRPIHDQYANSWRLTSSVVFPIYLMHISVISILLTYWNGICWLVFYIYVSILHGDIESRMQQWVTYFCSVFVSAVFGGVRSVTKCPRAGSASRRLKWLGFYPGFHVRGCKQEPGGALPSLSLLSPCPSLPFLRSRPLKFS